MDQDIKKHISITAKIYILTLNLNEKYMRLIYNSPSRGVIQGESTHILSQFPI